MVQLLESKKVAILVEEGFEQSELNSPRRALEQAGAITHVVSPKSGRIRGWEDGDWADEVEVDVPLEEARPDEYDALVLPGGVINPDKLRRDDRTIGFIRTFFQQQKTVAAICHGPSTLIDAEVVRGRRMTSFHSIRKDLMNAGAEWEDSPVVFDNGLITSRHPGDLEFFNTKLIEEIAAGRHAAQHA